MLTLRSWICSAAFVAASVPAFAQRPAIVEALDGVDPVLLIQGKETPGKPDLKVVRGAFEYLFASPETKATFEKDPARYEIQMGGLCARMGKATGGRPSDFLVYNGKIYIFGSDECHKRFAADPTKYLETPAPPLPASASAISSGRAAIAKAVAAAGGAAVVDRIATYVETSSVVQKRPTGDVSVTMKTTWRFPGSVRLDRSMTLQTKTMSSATLMTPAGVWYLYQGQAYPGSEAGRPSLQLDFGRQIVPLLHARKDASFKAAALGRGSVAGATVDRVRVVNGGVDVTLGLNPASGRVQNVSFTDRDDEGVVSEFTVVYSDFRTVNGLTVPFAERTLVRGVPNEALTRTIQSIAVNPEVDRAVFEPGPSGGR